MSSSYLGGYVNTNNRFSNESNDNIRPIRCPTVLVIQPDDHVIDIGIPQPNGTTTINTTTPPPGPSNLGTAAAANISTIDTTLINTYANYRSPPPPPPPAAEANDAAAVPNRPPPRNNTRSSDNLGIRRWCFTIIFCVLVFSLAIFLLVVVMPDIPHMTNHKPEFQIDSMLVSPLEINLTTFQITANWEIGISVKNHNKHVPIAYNNFGVSVFYDTDRYLSKTTLFAPFRQGSKNKTELIVKPQARLQNLNRWVAGSIADDMFNGTVTFDVKLEVRLKYIDTYWRTKTKDRVTAACKDLKVTFSAINRNADYVKTETAGTMFGRSKQCVIDDRERN